MTQKPKTFKKYCRGKKKRHIRFDTGDISEFLNGNIEKAIERLTAIKEANKDCQVLLEKYISNDFGDLYCSVTAYYYRLETDDELHDRLLREWNQMADEEQEAREQLRKLKERFEE